MKAVLINQMSKVKVYTKYNDWYRQVYEIFRDNWVRAGASNENVVQNHLRWLDPVFLGGYHPTLKLSGITTFTFIVSLTHRMDNI